MNAKDPIIVPVSSMNFYFLFAICVFVVNQDVSIIDLDIRGYCKIIVPEILLWECYGLLKIVVKET